MKFELKKKFSFLCFNVMTYATNPIPGAPKELKRQKENRLVESAYKDASSEEVIQMV